MKGGQRGWLALSVIAAGLGGAAIGVAAQSAGTGVVHGCYAKHGGALRVAATCHSDEKAISWNRQGRPGTPGTARAYAFVNGSVSSPSLASGRTKGFTAVTEPRHGIYCLKAPGIDPARTAPAVSRVYFSGFAGIPTGVRLDSPNYVCAKAEFEVQTTSLSYSNKSGLSELPAPNLPFTIVVP